VCCSPTRAGVPPVTKDPAVERSSGRGILPGGPWGRAPLRQHADPQCAAHGIVPRRGSPPAMVHASRLVFPPDPSAPDQLWESQQPYIGHLWWHAQTFGRRVEQCSFITWEALDRANAHLWETTYVPRALYARWPTWQAWLEEQRVWLRMVQDVYAAQHGQRGRPWTS
jgi:hypothetical protein